MVTNQYANSPKFYRECKFFLSHLNLNKLKASIIINLNIRKKITAYYFFSLSLQVLSRTCHYNLEAASHCFRGFLLGTSISQ